MSVLIKCGEALRSPLYRPLLGTGRAADVLPRQRVSAHEPSVHPPAESTTAHQASHLRSHNPVKFRTFKHSGITITKSNLILKFLARCTNQNNLPDIYIDGD